MRPGLMIGAPHVIRYTVPVHQTPPNLLPALAEFRRLEPVFATGFMVGLMEAPCVAALYPHLEPGEVTVGTLIKMTHLAASPPGTSLVAEARATAIEGRSVRFAVVVADGVGDIAATGEVGLRVVEVARFRDRLAAKQAQLRRLGSSPLPYEHQPVAIQSRHPPAMTRVDVCTRSHTLGGKHGTARIHLTPVPADERGTSYQSRRLPPRLLSLVRSVTEVTRYHCTPTNLPVGHRERRSRSTRVALSANWSDRGFCRSGAGLTRRAEGVMTTITGAGSRTLASRDHANE